MKVCLEHFGNEWIKSSHFKNAVAGDPRINIQISIGKAKPYQVEQVIEALIRLKNDKEVGKK